MTDLGWDPLRSRAVLIGTSSYRHLPAVAPAANSLARMERVLTSDLCGWPTDRVTVRPDIEKPGELPDELVELFADAADVALFYYVGHGLVDDLDHLCLCLVGTRTEASRRRTTSLPFEAVRHAFRLSPAKTKIVILDCCYAGMAERPTLGHEALVDRARVNGTFTMAAAGEFDLAWYETDPRDDPQTYFTKYLLDVIENGVEENGDDLRLDVIFTEAQAGLEAARKPVPTSTARHRAPHMVFARNVRSGAVARERPHPAASFPVTFAADPYWRSDPDDLSAAGRRLNGVAAMLYDRVRRFLNEELAQVLEHPLDMKWSMTTPALMGSWENINQHYRSRSPNTAMRATGPVDLTGGTADVLATLDRVASGRLAFIGPPGSGKTVALHLAARQLAARSALGGEAIPVPLDLAAWDPRRRTLRKWIAKELRSRWDVRDPPRTGTGMALLDAGLIYPVFDGLDAMPAAGRAAGYQQIVGSRMPFLLACRAEEFSAVVSEKGPPTATAVVELQPVSVERLTQYLETLPEAEALQALSTGDISPDPAGDLGNPRMIGHLRSAQPDEVESVARVLRSAPDSVGESLLRSAWRRFCRDAPNGYADALRDAAGRLATTGRRFPWQWCVGRRPSIRGWLEVAGPMALLAGLATFSTAVYDWSSMGLRFAGGAATLGLAVAALCTSLSRISVRITWAIAGLILGATVSSPIAFSEASPQYRNVVPDPYGYVDYAPTMSLKDWPYAMLGGAILTAVALSFSAVGCIALSKWVTTRAQTPGASMSAVGKVLIACFVGVWAAVSALMGLLSWNVFYVGSLALFQGITIGALVAFLTALAVETDTGILRARSSRLRDVLRLAERRQLIRPSGAMYEFTDARLAAIVGGSSAASQEAGRQQSKSRLLGTNPATQS